MTATPESESRRKRIAMQKGESMYPKNIETCPECGNQRGLKFKGNCNDHWPLASEYKTNHSPSVEMGPEPVNTLLTQAKPIRKCEYCDRGWVTRFPGGRVKCDKCNGIGAVPAEPKEALLTSKPEPVAEKCPTCGKKYAGDDSDATESMLIANGQRCSCKPVAPVRKWRADDVK